MLLSGMLVMGLVSGSVFASEMNADPSQITEMAAEGTTAGEEQTHVAEIPADSLDASEESASEEMSDVPEEEVAEYYTVTLDAISSRLGISHEDAKALIANGCICVGEISNMGCTPEAIDAFIDNKMIYAPGKAVNAGGVATSGLEMSQNAMHLSWTAEEVDKQLHKIMHNIHEQCVKYGKQPDGYVNYVKGANIAGFMKVARAMMAQGIV